MKQFIYLGDGCALMTAAEYKRRGLSSRVHHCDADKSIETWKSIVEEVGFGEQSTYRTILAPGIEKRWVTKDNEGRYVLFVVDVEPENHYIAPGIPEAWEVIEALQSSWPEDVRYHVGNVLKYVFRLGRKQGASVESDLEKIRNYADRAIKVLGKSRG